MASIPYNSVSIIGAGNVGSHLASAFYQADMAIDFIYSRDLSNARGIVQGSHTVAIDTFSDLRPTSDLYIICIPDDHIASVTSQLRFSIPNSSCVVHTSGSRPSSDLYDFEHRGVFYPLQTFTKGENVDFESIPILIHSDEDEVLEQLKQLASSISQQVVVCNDLDRSEIHLAAVMANNFVNHLIYKAEDHLKRHNIDPTILHPLIKQTIEKALNSNVYEAQTGPARRHDLSTIKKHLKKLNYSTTLRKLYKRITKSILKSYLK